MKRFFILSGIALACAAMGWITYLVAAPAPAPPLLSKYVPAGPVVYVEAKDFSTLIGDWNSSPQKKQWLTSDNYEIFSRSRLFLRLKGASDQFAAAAGLPPDMTFLSQVAGERSVFALYDIGNLQFLYITYLPSAKSMQTMLWQTRSKFEPRSAGGVDFYLRRDPQSQRAVAFAVSGDYLLLSTREDLMAGALQLMSGKQDRTVADEQWWAQSTAAAGQAGDLRMVLNLEELVPNGYFRTYWVQQNITGLKQCSAALSDLYRSSNRYWEERVLIKKEEPKQASSPDGPAAVADVVRLVPSDAGVYRAEANPSSDVTFALLETKLLAPNLGPVPASQIAPQMQLTSGEPGGGSDLETRIDQAPAERPVAPQSVSALKELLDKTPLLASLHVQSTAPDQAGVFVRIHSALVLVAASEWNQSAVQSALTDFVHPGLTASQLGIGWQQESGYQKLDGLWPLAVSVCGSYLLISDEPALAEAILANFSRKSDRKPADLLAGLNHQQERANFARFSRVVDRPSAAVANAENRRGEPQFFSNNMASLSSTLAAVSAEEIEVRSDGNQERQTVIYEWAQ
jgi:hypothetical protein